jgi:hypothetical protein
MSLAGTGTDAIKELVGLWKGLQRHVTGEVNSVAQALATGLAMAGLLLQSELHGGPDAQTLRHKFGGGYEVAAFFDGRFRKVSDMTFLMWQANVTPGRVRISPPQLIVKQKYLDDILLLRSARIAVEAVGQPKLVDEQRHAISPMYSPATKISDQDLVDISFDSRLLCHCFMVHGPGRSDPAIDTRVQHVASTTEPTMKFQDESGRLVLSLNTSFLREVERELQEGFARRP